MTPGVLHRWRRYPKYKGSEVEWLGEVPEGWEVTRLGWHIDLLTGFPFKSELFSFDEGIKLVRGDNVTEGKLRWGEKTRSWIEVTDALKMYLLKSEDLLIGMDGSKVGKNYALVHPEDLPLLLVQRVARLRTVGSIQIGFLYRLIGSKLFFTWVELTKTDPAIPHISPKNIQNFPISLPTVPEQAAIATFLDRETARIDALIARKKRQIELLTEKRASLISHAVTKGLDPSVPMKDSGIEWIGDVPEHYRILPIKRFIKIRYGLGEPPKELETGLPIVRATNIDQGKIIDEGMMLVDPKDVPASRDAFLRENEIIIVRSGANTGDSTIIPKKYAGSLSGYDMVVTVKDGVPGYFAWQFLTPEVRDLQFGFCKLRAAQPHLNAEELGNTLFVIPPNDEQESISTYIRQNTDRIDCIHQKIVVSITKLQEYRSALISAALTGKIDVRQEAKA